MKTKLRNALLLLALLALVSTAATWATTGANRGWTRTSISEMHRDEITGIDYPVTHAGFLPGLDFLAVGTALSVALAGTAWLTGRGAARHS